MKTLVSAATVREAHAGGRKTLPGGKDILVTPEARGLAEQYGMQFTSEAEANVASTAGELDPIRAAVLAKLPPETAARSEVVDQIVAKVRAAHDRGTPSPAGVAPTVGGIRLVRGADVPLGLFSGAGEDRKVGIADVITAADGAPIAAGFMAWQQCFFPWTLDYDEIDLVLEGELHIRCDGQTLVGTPGDVLYIPKGSAIEFGTPGSVRFFYVTYPADWQA